MTRILLGLFLLIVGIVAFNSRAPDKPAVDSKTQDLVGPTLPPKTPAADSKCNHAAAKRRVEALFNRGELGNGPSDGVNVNVSVNEFRWRAQPYAEKNAIAEDLNCTLAGPGKSLINLVFRSHTSNKIVGKWDGLKLVIP